MKNPVAIFFLSLFSAVILLVWTQQLFNPIKLAGLQGAYDPGKWPEWSARSWFSGNYQMRADHYLKYNTAFNGELIRLRNQFDYSVFGNINTMLLLGKENYLFDPSYVEAMEGKDLVHDSILHNSMQQLKGFISSDSIPVLILFAPNKAAFYSEYLPSLAVPVEQTNRSRYKKHLTEAGIPYIDFDQWFYSIRDTSSWPLIPKYGAHWSTWGSAFAGDSVINILRQLLQTDLSDYTITGTDTTSEARYQDDDYLPSLNLMYKWKSPVLAYPVLQFHEGVKPNILFISDSFIWNFYDIGMMDHCMDQKSHVIYYFKTIYDMQRNQLGAADKFPIEKILEGRDAIVILSSDPSLKNFGFGFFEATGKSSQP